jgi:hypothetical protein
MPLHASRLNGRRHHIGPSKPVGLRPCGGRRSGRPHPLSAESRRPGVDRLGGDEAPGKRLAAILRLFDRSTEIDVPSSCWRVWIIESAGEPVFGLFSARLFDMDSQLLTS